MKSYLLSIRHLMPFLLLAGAVHAGSPSAELPARVVVTENVAAADPQPFGLNQLNGKWGVNHLGFNNGVNGYEARLIRDRFFVMPGRFGTTADNRSWFYPNGYGGVNPGLRDGYWQDASVRIYRPTVQPDGVTTYQRIANSTIQASRMERQFWRVSFGLDNPLTSSAGELSVSFRYALDTNRLSYTDGRLSEWYQQTDLPNGTTCWYAVRAIDRGGNFSADSNIATAAPSAAAPLFPRIITHQIGFIKEGATSWDALIESTDGNGTLTWSVVSGLTSKLEAVEKTVNERKKLQIKLKAGSTAGAAEAARIVLTIRVQDAAGNFDVKTVILNPFPPEVVEGDSVPPEPPQNLTATVMNGAVHLSWQPSPSPDVAGYIVYRSNFAPADQEGRLELASNVNLQEGDLIFVEKEFNTTFGNAALVHDRALYTAFKSNFNDPEWKMPGGKWIGPMSAKNTGFVPEFQYDYVPHPEPVPAGFTTRGEQCVRMSVPAGWGMRTTLSVLNRYSGLFYRTWEAGKTYRARLWVRQTGIPDGKVTLAISGYESIFKQTFTVPSNQWTQIVVTNWTPAVMDNKTSVESVYVEVPAGGTLWFDHFEFFEYSDENSDGQPDDPPLKMTRYWKNQLKDFFRRPSPDDPHPCFRYWGLQSNDGSGTALDEVLKPKLQQRQMGSQDFLSLPEFLDLCLEVKARPWIIASLTLTEQEYAGLIEYLAGDASTVYGAKRIADRGGNPVPWTDEFEKIYIECHNEAWNGMFAWGFFDRPDGDSAKGYGQYAEMLFRALKNSPVWQADPAGMDAKVDLVLNGWNTGATWGYDAALAAPSGEMVDVAPYLGGWESGSYIGGTTLTDEGFSKWLVYAPWKHYDQVQTHVGLSRDAEAARGTPYRLGVYEGGPGYDLPSADNPSGDVPESYGKSLAAALTTLDCYMYESYNGYDAQAFFGFTVGTRWTTHSIAVNDAQTAIEFRPQASWLAQQLRNNYASGALLQTYALSMPYVDLPPEAGQPGRPGTPLVASYAFRDGTDYMVMLLSRRLAERDGGGAVTNEAITPVVLNLPFKSAGSVSLHRITGDPRSCNVPGLPYYDPQNQIEIESATIDPALVKNGEFQVIAASGGASSPDGLRQGIPPGGIYLYVFKNTQSDPLPAEPVVQIQRAPDQPMATFDTTARFHVLFDRPMTGLTVADIDLSASTAVLSNATVTVAPLDPLIEHSLVWSVEVSGLSGPGLVQINLPAGAVAAVSGGALSPAVSGAAAAVQIIPSIAYVAFDPAQTTVATKISCQRAFTGDATQDTWITLDLATPFFPASGQQPVYGGIRARGTYLVDGVPKGLISASSFILAKANEGGSGTPQPKVEYNTASDEDSATASWVVYLWKKADFYGGFNNPGVPLALNAGASLQLDLGEWKSSRIFYFVVKDGSRWYLSQTSYAGDNSTFALNSFVGNPDQKWAEVAFTEGTADFSSVLDDAALLSFQPQSFTNVQAVGFAAKDAATYRRYRAFTGFRATAVTDSSPYLARDLSAPLSVVRTGGIELSLSVLDADSPSLTFTWSVIAKPAGAVAAFSGGTVTTNAPGTLAANYVTLSAPGIYRFRTSVSDGTATIQSGILELEVAGESGGDSDFDGIPDWWEELYFGSPTGAVATAPAANGINTVLQCYIAGLDPTDPDSIFQVEKIGAPNPYPVLMWNGLPGRVYHVYGTTNLLSGFQLLQSNISGNVFTATVHGAQSSGFFRVDVELED